MAWFKLYGNAEAGPVPASASLWRASFCLRAIRGPGAAVTAPGIFSRRSRARAPSPDYPPVSYPLAVLKTAAAAWRNLIGKFRSGTFFPEAEAQRRTLAPGLPHHRHPLTADEALAGIVLVIGVFGSVLYVIARWL